MTTTRLEELELYKDCGGYFLKARYTVEDDTMKKEIRFPRIRFDVSNKHLSIIHDRDNITSINMGLDSAYFVVDTGLDEKTGLPVKMINEILEEKTKEMTVDEIEKKLGYKIKIVSKGGER